jgi:methionine-rich copper-binding protein CopC
MNSHDSILGTLVVRLILVALAAATVVSWPATASAHETVIMTKPSGKAKIGLKRVSLTFNAPIRGGTVRVFGPAGRKVSKGTGGRDPQNFSRLRVSLKRGLAPGRYTVRARWMALDGHTQTFTYVFRLTR